MSFPNTRTHACVVEPLFALQALWLANMSSVILFYPYLKNSFLTPIKQVLGQTMEFKTTLKGGNNGGFNFRTFGPALLITVLNIVTFSVGLATLDKNINAAKSISLCWIVFNTVPHLLLLLNGYFGPGLLMVGICKICMFVTNASGILAIILMWLLYPREVKFVKPLAASIKFMQVCPRKLFRKLTASIPNPSQMHLRLFLF
jgi:hypothetical protein